MNRIDRAIVAGLLLVIVVAAAAIGGQSPLPPVASATPSVGATEPATYIEGVLGRPVAVNPLAAASQADRDLVALVFEGLVTLDRSGAARPALARTWSSSPDGATWTFTLRPDARWHDGQPVTADDVVFTITALQDPAYHGPGAGSWTGITASAVDPATVKLELSAPIAGLLQLATQPIAPAHLLADIPPAAMADDAFGRQPVGSGPYALVELDSDHALLEPAGMVAAPADGPAPSGAASLDPLATTRPTPRAGGGAPSVGRIELRFFDDTETLASEFRAGQVDAASGLAPGTLGEVAALPGARVVRDPMTTLVAVALNLRPSHPELSDSRTRGALLAAIDRDALAAAPYDGMAERADGLIPPSSWAFDPTAAPPVGKDTKAASALLTSAGWKRQKDGWHAGAAAKPQTLQLLVPDHTTNPIAFAVGQQVAADWRTLGFGVDLLETDPTTLAAEHLGSGDFTAAIVSIAVGHDPDLYPLLASSQTRTGGANVFGLQDPILDGLLEAARKPVATDARRTALAAVQKRLAEQDYILPLVWPESVTAVDSRLTGTADRTVSDGSERFWDVLDWRLADDR
jgi:peptide/nickel transport system substrate-binding protein